MLRILLANLPLLPIYRARWRYLHGGDSHARFLGELRAFAEREKLVWPAGRNARLGYYLVGVDLLLFWLAGLYGRKPSMAERRLGWHMACLVPLGDDLADQAGRKAEEVARAVLQQPREQQTAEERLLGYVYHFILQHHPDPASFQPYLQAAMQAQNESLAQKQGKLSREDLLHIAYQKGGTALIMLRSSLAEPIPAAENPALRQLGGFIQLLNDLFDVYRDEQEGVQTLANQAEDIRLFRREWELAVENVLGAFDRWAVPERRKMRFRRQLEPLLAVAEVCFDQYERLQEKSGGRFLPATYSRKELVCDMEKPINLWRALRKLNK
jgi:hypothetical protein